MGNGKHVLPVLQCFEVGIAFVSSLVFVCTVVEPPELQHLTYTVDPPPKVEVPQATPEQSNEQLNVNSEITKSRSGLKKNQAKPEAEVKQEAVQPEVAKQETSKEKKEMDRPPIFVTLQ